MLASIKHFLKNSASRAGYHIINDKRWAELEDERCALLRAAVANLPARDFTGAPVAECIVFSKDRPMQVAALLASFREKVRPQIPVHVLYRASTEAFARGYELAFQAFGEGVIPHRENRFRDDLIALLDGIRAPRVFFLVDDNLFKESVDLTEIAKADASEIIFSLRLGTNVTESQHRPLRAPKFSEHPSFPGKLSWQWQGADVEWGYPLSIDGHVFSTAEMRIVASSFRYVAPNSFEGCMQSFNSCFNRRWGVCYPQSALFNIPANLVQTEVKNEAGNVSVEYLLDRWLAGDAIDHREFYGFRNTAAHMLLDLPIVKRSAIPVYGGV